MFTYLVFNVASVAGSPSWGLIMGFGQSDCMSCVTKTCRSWKSLERGRQIWTDRNGVGLLFWYRLKSDNRPCDNIQNGLWLLLIKVRGVSSVLLADHIVSTFNNLSIALVGLTCGHDFFLMWHSTQPDNTVGHGQERFAKLKIWSCCNCKPICLDLFTNFDY